MKTARYPAFIDGEAGAYGVSFPDLPGVVAMGSTVEEALANAVEALAEAAMEMKDSLPRPTPLEKLQLPEGALAVTTVPLLRLTGKARRANLTLDEGVLAFIDEEAKRRGMTRKAFIEWMARFVAEHAA
jgi:predicted RNase H-like HicB family nuclease